MVDNPISPEQEANAAFASHLKDAHDNRSLKVNAEAIRAADIVWAVGPDPEWILVYTCVKSVKLGLIAAAESIYPSDVKVLYVPCSTNAEVDALCTLVDEVKGSP